MGFKYEVKEGKVEMAGPGGDVIVIESGKPYESETPLLEYPESVKETKTEAKTEKPSSTKSDEGGAS